MTDEVEDDLTIEDGDGLLRRVPNWPIMVKYDENIGSYRPSSACFSDPEGGTQLSITLQRSLLDAGGTIEDAVTRYPGFGLAKLTAGFVRHEITPSQIVMRQPTCDDPHHGLVIGEKRLGERRKMAKLAIMLIRPTMPSSE